jgi:eukaryotic-like serine/threonine-protein kinase
MAKADADRNLLFGLVALQSGLVDPSGVVAAFQSWVRDKSRSLAEHLVLRGGLSIVQRMVMEELVNLHLEQDAQALEGSLAESISRDGLASDASAFTAPSSNQKRVGVEEEDKDDESDSDGAELTRTHVRRGEPSSGRRFQILRSHAEGGLGEVFVAHDRELNREVALKQIKGEQAHDPECCARFLREAEITGRLEHPGIVPVYGVTQLSDGRPQYAMRFIRGDSLKSAIAGFHSDRGVSLSASARALELRKLLGALVDVCNTMEYAHSRSIIHRDLKPANIMLGPYGETLVVDWGLAKPVDGSDGTPDERLRPSSNDGIGSPTFGPVGTPHYMSPEQAAGEHHRIGIASDIYSLGATLYCLLTGKPPIQGKRLDHSSVLAKVRAGEFTRPRQVNAAVPAALESVCLKAMKIQPEDRYSSARALGDDIERWLADEPVSAYVEPRRVRLGRWARRHRRLVAGAAVFVVSAVLFLIFHVVRVGRERAEAEDNFLMARDAVNELLTELGAGRLAGVPAAEELRGFVAERALKFNERFLRKQPSDPDVRRDVARIYREVANIHRMLGRLDDASKGYEKAVALREGLAKQFPEEGQAQADLALTIIDAGNPSRIAGRPRAAEPYFARALRIGDDLARRDGASRDSEIVRGMALFRLAETQSETARPEEALRSSTEAGLAFRTLAQRFPYGPRAFVLLSFALVQQSRILRESGRSDEADPCVADSIGASEIAIDVFSKSPDGRERPLTELIPDARYAHAAALVELSALRSQESGRLGSAENPLRMAVSELSKLSQEFPRVVEYQRKLGEAHLIQAETHAASGHAADADASCRQARAILEKLRGGNPELADVHVILAKVLRLQARLSLEKRDAEAAKALYSQALTELQPAIRANPESTRLRELEAQCHSGLKSAVEMSDGASRK